MHRTFTASLVYTDAFSEWKIWRISFSAHTSRRGKCVEKCRFTLAHFLRSRRCAIKMCQCKLSIAEATLRTMRYVVTESDGAGIRDTSKKQTKRIIARPASVARLPQTRPVRIPSANAPARTPTADQASRRHANRSNAAGFLTGRWPRSRGESAHDSSIKQFNRNSIPRKRSAKRTDVTNGPASRMRVR